GLQGPRDNTGGPGAVPPKKYIFLTFLASWLLLFFFGGDQNWPHWTDRDGDPSLPSPRERQAARLSVYKNSRCRMETCFDFSRCEKHGFKVFTYPRERDQPLSESYSKILASIERSRYYTPSPEEACLFILSIDTLGFSPRCGDTLRLLTSLSCCLGPVTHHRVRGW
uniref:Exostosin GT47 domain-containing protein n=1 Tax=Athene cunicularia TaxID=194338 RepID=A0A663NBV9_ATHCN